jgi:hypothetical protein
MPTTPSEEALLAAWRGLAGFEGRSSLRSGRLRDAEVVGLTSFLDPEVHRRFALPLTVAPGSTR